MWRIRKGDIVTRESYNNDLIFYVVKIVRRFKQENLAILKGLNFRIEADSPIDDLRIVNKEFIKDEFYDFENKIKNIVNSENREILSNARVLHLDGDKKYSEKTARYYSKIGLNAFVKHIPEYKQPFVIENLLERIKPNILIITGHDGIIRRGKNYNDINNYRNSKYFVQSVLNSRMWNANKEELIIFAGACQSYYEMLIYSGANFASSPARILIDFIDPLIVCEEIAITSANKMVYTKNFESKIRSGRRAIDGIGAKGQGFVI